MSLLFSGKLLLANELLSKGHSMCDLVTQLLIFNNLFLLSFCFCFGSFQSSPPPFVWFGLNYHALGNAVSILPPVFRIDITGSCFINKTIVGPVRQWRKGLMNCLHNNGYSVNRNFNDRAQKDDLRKESKAPCRCHGLKKGKVELPRPWFAH